jgi:peptide chain release factor subunit 1
MEAGYVDARRTIDTRLRHLAEVRLGVPVLSLFLDLDPTQFDTLAARRSAITSLLDTAHKQVEEHGTDHDGRVSLRADLERARTFFDSFAPKGGRAAAVFAATGADLFEAFLLPRPVPTRAVIDDSPYITPLIGAADQRDWLIVLVSARDARFLHGNRDRMEEIEALKDPLPGQHEQAGTIQNERRIEEDVERHLKRVAAELDEQLGASRYERVLVGGTKEATARLEERMSNPAREKLGGRIDVDISSATIDDVREAAARPFELDERRRERNALERLAAGLARGERAVAGVEAVREMLLQRRVAILLYDERHAPPDSVLERAIEEAITQSAEVLPVRFEPEELDGKGHIAAVLRF